MKILQKIFGMQGAVVGLLLFALSIAVATFVENDYGTPTAKAEIYNAHWFELLQLFLVVVLINNVYKFKMYKNPFSMKFIFHSAFIIIFIGAVITRYVGFEGTLHVREGGTENRMLSALSYVQMGVNDGKSDVYYEKKVLFSKISSNRFDETFSDGKNSVDLKLVKYIPSAGYELVESPKGAPIFTMMVVGKGGPETVTLQAGEFYENATTIINFGAKRIFTKPVVNVSMKDGVLYLDHPMPLFTMSMDTKKQVTVPATHQTPFNMRVLYGAGETRFVLKNYMEKGEKKLVSKEATVRNRMRMKAPLKDALVFEATVNKQKKRFTVFGENGVYGEDTIVNVGGLRLSVSYGAKLITLPFAIHLKDFELKRYPGSNAPSSYSSHVVLLDKEANVTMPYHIYMNHILDYQGYRVFQASYDMDEKGTVLSINYDPGTLPTYIGYILLAFGLFGSFFSKKGRFQNLRKKLEGIRAKRAALTMLALLFTAPMMDLHAQESSAELLKQMHVIDAKHANKFGHLLVQNAKGRLEPVDSLANDVLIKVYKHHSILGLNANQVLLGMMNEPRIWQKVPMIKLQNPEIAKLVGMDKDAKYAPFNAFYPVGMNDTYVLENYVNDARRKPAKTRNRMDKALLKVDEAVHICRMMYVGVLLNIFPKESDKQQKWYDLYSVVGNLIDAERTAMYYKQKAKDSSDLTLDTIKKYYAPDAKFSIKQAMDVREVLSRYFMALGESIKSGDWSKSDEALARLKGYQQFTGAAIYPPEWQISLEITYNHIDIFVWLMGAFLIVGLTLLAAAFYKIIQPKISIDKLMKVSLYTLYLLFTLYTLGLVARWIIAGHAPWSNGYEAIVYIGWATMLAGLLVARNAPLTLAATAIMSGVTLLVAMLSSFDPQITNLVPVLKSYWLTIHVSMITASYGFLGLSALLGFIGLILFIVLNDTNKERISLAIKELNYVAEMSILGGLALLTVGNFLGGVWANESWGRYWGWDAKETWALVSILVYASVAHIRYVPKLYTDFRFSVISLLAYSSILMTFFGVNYYLSGLHSYAKGDPVPVPTWVYFFILTIVIVIIAAALKKHRFVK